VILNLAGQAVSVTNQHLIVEIDPTASSQLVGVNTVYFAVGTGGGTIAATVVYSTGGWRACASWCRPQPAGTGGWAADRILPARG
jgi:hypothetical protein